MGPTEKDAAADSLCAAASMPTLSLSLPSLSLSLTRPMRSLPSPTRPQVRLRVVSIELLCAAMSSEALKACLLSHLSRWTHATAWLDTSAGR